MAGRIKLRDINQAPGIRADASGGNDPLPGFQGGVQGSIAYRGARKWEVLGPSGSGKALTTNGPGANPTWTTVSTTGNGNGNAQQLTLTHDNPTVGLVVT